MGCILGLFVPMLNSRGGNNGTMLIEDNVFIPRRVILKYLRVKCHDICNFQTVH